MRETLKMMESVILGKEKDLSESEIVLQYQKTLAPNLLAYMFKSNFAVINSVGLIYPILDEADKASFCLQELDKALQNFDINKDVKFITFFVTCYKNRLRMETESYMMKKRRINLFPVDISMISDIYTEFTIQDSNLILSNYKLTEYEKNECKLLDAGYTLKEIASFVGKSTARIHGELVQIRKKISIESIKTY